MAHIDIQYHVGPSIQCCYAGYSLMLETILNLLWSSLLGQHKNHGLGQKLKYFVTKPF